MRRLSFLALALLMVTAFAACGTEDEGGATGDVMTEPASVAVTATDYAFEAPASVGAGAVSISMTNNGQEPHQAVLFKLNEGQTAASMIEAAKATPNSWRSFGDYAGGPFAGPMGGTGANTVDLEPGNYALMCEIPDAAGTPHLALGMATDLEVTETAEDRAEAPAADQEATGTEMEFTLPAEWDGTVKFTNTGQQPHELVIAGAAEGATIDQAFQALTAEGSGEAPAGPPPFTLPGGASPIGPGQSAWFEVDLPPGEYYAVCFVADLTMGGAPHFTQGMQQKFEVG